MKSKINYFLILISFILGFFITFIILGFSKLSPTNIDWISTYDAKSDFLALKFFLNDKWRFPLGSNPNYGTITNSIVFSGAVPLLSFISKLFKAFLPNNFHFFSFWIILCISLQFYYANKIFYLITKNNFFSFLCGLFFLLIPILYYRISIHLSLSAHWIILGYFYYEFRKSNYNELYKIILIVLSSLVHFYITIMLLMIRLVFSLSTYFENKNLKSFLTSNFILIIILVFFMFLSGYFVLPSTDTLGYGYGIYKSNLLSFFDPIPYGSNQNWSVFIPNIENQVGEQEGFAYLGVGGIILSSILLTYLFKNPKVILNNKKYISLSVILFLISLSNNVSFGQIELASIPLPKYIYAVLSIIRASGRFIWPIYYLLIIFSLIAFFKFKIKIKYLVFILLIQLIDISYLFKENLFKNSDKHNLINENVILEESELKFTNAITTYSSDNSNIFFKVSDLLIFYNFKKTNMFRLGRYDRSEQSMLRTNLYNSLNQNDLDNNTLYFIDNSDHLRHLKYKLKNTKHGFFYRDNIWFIAPYQKELMSNTEIKNFKDISFNKIEIDKKKEVNFNDINGILGFGWSHGSYGKLINQKGAWTEGNNSFLIFDNSKENINYLDLEISKIVNDDKNPLIVNVYLNNKLIKTLKFLDDKKYEIDLDLKKNLIIGLNEILFEIKNPVTPVSKLESVDGRLLGFKLNTYKFR